MDKNPRQSLIVAESCYVGCMNPKAEKKTPKDKENKAVAYVRMSTEHQKYSTRNQEDVIRKYASDHGLEIIGLYSDGGKSGLRMEGRAGLQSLIDEVVSGNSGFSIILVYDISRWGRFQNTDESAHYEYLCHKAGVQIHYCAEQFENDGSVSSNLFKQVKRSMAGEYSRELSQKVSLGAERLARMGFRQGGVAGYGLRRMLVNESGDRKGVLGLGEHKSIQTDRVVLVPGPEEEVEVVRWIYGEFLKGSLDEGEIASRLRERRVRREDGRKWSRGMVREILTNEKYIGNNVYNRTSFKLKQRHMKNPGDQWIRKENAFEALVDASTFYRVRGVMEERARRVSDDEILERLKKLCTTFGKLSGFIIDESPELPSSSMVASRFGGLLRVYRLVGYSPETDYRYIEENRIIREQHPLVVSEIVDSFVSLGMEVEHEAESGLLMLDRMVTVSLVLSRCFQTKAGYNRWKIRLDRKLRPDFTLAARMNPGGEDVRDFYMLPVLGFRETNLTACDFNGIRLDSYRHDSISSFLPLLQISPLLSL